MPIQSIALLLGLFLATNCASAGVLRPGELLVTEREQEQLIAIDPESGASRVISGAGVAGDGPAFSTPRRVVVSPDQRIFVLGYGDNPLFEVDLETGDRSVLVGVDAGDEPGCCKFQGLVQIHDILFTVDKQADQIRRIDTRSGRHSLVGPYLGKGHQPIDLANARGGDLIVSSLFPDAIRRVDMATNGLIQVLADGSYAGPGLTLDAPTSIELSSSGIVYSTSLGSGLNSIMRFDPQTGERFVVTGSNRSSIDPVNPYERGAGPPLTSQSDLVMGLDGYLYVATSTGLVRVDPVSGDREMVLATGVGSGLRLGGLAVVPVPEPAAWLLAAITLLTYRRVR